MDRSEVSLSIGRAPISDAALGDQDEDIAYESGGMGFQLMGMTLICAMLWLASFMLGIKSATISIAGFGVVGAALVYYREAISSPRRRANEMREAAAALGLTYRADVPPEQLEQLRQLPPFNAGTRHKASNVLGGLYQGVPVYLLDFYYQIPGAKAAANFWQTVALIPGISGTPDFYLAPRRCLDSVAHWLGFQDISFSGDPASERFSHHYRLQGPEEQAVRTAFTGHAVGYLSEHPGWTVSCSGGHLVVWRTVPTETESKANFKLTGVIDPGFRYVVPAALPKVLARSMAIRQLFDEGLGGSTGP